MKKKVLGIGIILLFIGVALAPSINQSVVTASQEDDLVEVTTQACGIKGYGDTTVKLTREQYQNLEQYLVEFRARLNQTSTREEAIPIFKDAVVELDKYGLLPKGMSVEQAQQLVLGRYNEKNCFPFNQRFQNIISKNNLSNYNFLCLFSGSIGKCDFVIGPITSILLLIFDLCTPFGFLKNSNFADWFYRLSFFTVFYDNIILLNVLSIIYLGLHIDSMPNPANGTIWSQGLLGVKQWNGFFMGAFKHPYLRDEWFMETHIYHPGVIGFTGIDLLAGKNFYLGSALAIGITNV